MGIVIEHPGARTTVQDLGRAGLRSQGVAQGGAVDALALRVANLLVGNVEGAAALECVLTGPRVRFRSDALIAICGAGPRDLPRWRAFGVRAGERLDLADLRDGAYAYLAVSGGIDVPAVLGSRSTETRIGIGGLEGRALRAGDKLRIGSPLFKHSRDTWRVHHEPWYAPNAIRVLRGSDWDDYEPVWIDQPFRVTSRSDRMGLRLAGTALQRMRGVDLPSAPVCPGTIQVPPDGQPIVLLADAQTLGGYPRIAHVITADLPRLAQHRPGSTLRFVEVSLEQAHAALWQRERDLALLKQGIAGKVW